MEQEINLVDLQRNSKRIRNPFGFDFRVTWGGKPFVIPGNGEWQSLIGVLRDHAARHLYMKVRYQYHDEQVALLKASGKDNLARQYNVPRTMENKIWFLITGEALPGEKSAEEQELDKADLDVLKSELSSVDSQVSRSNEVHNISSLLEQANTEAVQAAMGSESDANHNSGTGKVNDAVVVPEGEVDLVAAQVEVQPQVTDTAGSETPPSEGEFPDLAELDNGSKNA